jgi:hypothetical protein
MKDYTTEVTCACGKTAKRDYENDLRFNVDTGPITLGRLAEINTKRMSPAERKRLYDKHNSYKSNYKPSEDSKDFYENRAISIGKQQQKTKGRPHGNKKR